MSELQSISNWSNYPKREALILKPRFQEECRKFIHNSRSITPRGKGRSYSDACLGEVILDSWYCTNMISFCEETGLLVAQAGVSLDEILEVFVPRGWFLPVTPGTRKVSLAGAFASDVHGKNHHCDGGFSSHVEFIELMIEDARILRASRSENSNLFWATAGGMGLTGFILKVGLYLIPIESSWIRQTAIQAGDFEELLCLFQEHEEDRYTVAWIDCLAKGFSLGRGVFLTGDHASKEEIGSRDALLGHGSQKFSVPTYFPHGTLNSMTIGIFNELYFNKQVYPRVESIVHYSSFFHPLDSLAHWNKIYGRAGFLQYQFVVPYEDGEVVMKKILEEISNSGFGSFLAVLKIFGEESPGYLSFPMKGYTLALDFPIKEGIFEMLDKLDEMVLESGGRNYLAKDSRMSASTFASSYDGGLKLLRSVLDEYCPQGVFQSDLSRRLGIQNER